MNQTDTIALIKKYFPKDQWENAYAVMMGESGGNAQAVGDNYPINGLHAPSYGLFQIRALPGRPDPKVLTDPEENVKYAAQLYKTQGWQPWTAAQKLGIVNGGSAGGSMPNAQLASMDTNTGQMSQAGAIGAKVKAIYPEYAGYSNEQLGMRFLAKYGNNKQVMSSLGVQDAVDPQEQVKRLEAEAKLKEYQQNPESIGKEDNTEKSEIAGALKSMLLRYKTVPDSAKGVGVGLLSQNIPGVSPEARRYQKMRLGLASTLKGLVGESGVLTNQDIDRIVGLSMDLNSPVKEQELAQQDLQTFLQEKGIPLNVQEVMASDELPAGATEEKVFNIKGEKGDEKPSEPQQPQQGIQDMTLGDILAKGKDVAANTGKNLALRQVFGNNPLAQTADPVSNKAMSVLMPNTTGIVEGAKQGEAPEGSQVSGALLETALGLVPGVGDAVSCQVWE